MLGAGGYAQEPAAKTKLPDPIIITSMITIKGGHQGLDKVELTIEHFPRSGNPIVLPLTISPSPALPPEQEALLTTTASVATAIGTKGAEAVIVKLAPIPGWKATPEEYRLTASNEQVKFTLEKVERPQSAPVSKGNNYLVIGLGALGAIILVVGGLAFSRRGKSKKGARARGE